MFVPAVLFFSLLVARSGGTQDFPLFHALVNTFNGLYYNDLIAFDYDFGTPSSWDKTMLNGTTRISLFSNVSLLPSSYVTEIDRTVAGSLDLRHNDYIIVDTENGMFPFFRGCRIQINYTVPFDLDSVHQESVTVSDCQEDSLDPDHQHPLHLEQLSEALTVKAKEYFSFNHFMHFDHAKRFETMQQAVGVYLTWQK